MQVRDLVVTNIPIVAPDTSAATVASRLTEAKSQCALVMTGDRLAGLISDQELRTLIARTSLEPNAPVSELMIPASKLAIIPADAPIERATEILAEHKVVGLPVTEGDTVLGVLTRDTVLTYFSWQDVARREREAWERRAGTILKSLHEGLIVIDCDLVIREYNAAAERLTGNKASERLGQKAKVISVKESPVFKVLSTGQPIFNEESQLKDGRWFLANYVPLIEEGKVTGVIQTFSDISEQKELQKQLQGTRDELDKAFALTLPNSKVEHKLKHSPEYRDLYLLHSKKIQITEVISDGCYQHVVNSMRVAADLNEKGVMNLVGINKDTIVQSIVFHDIGKSQPQLAVGDIVDPKKTFEEGYLHAFRSADIAGNFYSKNSDIVNLIKYHHHEENILPPDFPSYLLPMHRLLRVIDGLSACLTRRKGNYAVVADGSRLLVSEHNGHPQFNNEWSIDLFTGERHILQTFPVSEEVPQVANATAT
ncbi:MAG: CBS domain-containing protein [Bacillota bacterium]